MYFLLVWRWQDDRRLLDFRVEDRRRLPPNRGFLGAFKIRLGEVVAVGAVGAVGAVVRGAFTIFRGGKGMGGNIFFSASSASMVSFCMAWSLSSGVVRRATKIRRGTIDGGIVGARFSGDDFGEIVGEPRGVTDISMGSTSSDRYIYFFFCGAVIAFDDTKKNFDRVEKKNGQNRPMSLETLLGKDVLTLIFRQLHAILMQEVLAEYSACISVLKKPFAVGFVSGTCTNTYNYRSLPKGYDQIWNKYRRQVAWLPPNY